MPESLTAAEIAELETQGHASVSDGKLAALLAMASRLVELDWVPCSERIPPTGLAVIVDGGVGYFDGIDWRTLMGSDAHRKVEWTVTHWRRIGTPPAQANGG